MRFRIFCATIFVTLVTQCVTESITGLESLIQGNGFKTKKSEKSSELPYL